MFVVKAWNLPKNGAPETLIGTNVKYGRKKFCNNVPRDGIQTFYAYLTLSSDHFYGRDAITT
jgi:hypothetical protein